jgi:predicted site-specific integrase-resolvase
MSNYKCLKDSKTKTYIIPTNEWLEPLNELITDSISTKGLLMLSKFRKTHDVVVKITRNITNNYPIIEFAGKNLLDMPNFVKTFCSFKCDESTINLDNKYNGVKSYCMQKTTNIVTEEISIEIMYKYRLNIDKKIYRYLRGEKIKDFLDKNTLHPKRGLLNKDTVEHIMKQLIFGQLNAFQKIGFLHMDIHLYNIMYADKTNEIELNYLFSHKNLILSTTEIVSPSIRNYSIKTTREFILCDLDKCIIFNSNITLPPHNENNLLIMNIIQTINRCSELFDTVTDKNTFRKISDLIQNHERDYFHYERKDLRTFYKTGKTLEEYKEDVLQIMNIFVAKMNGLRKYKN